MRIINLNFGPLNPLVAKLAYPLLRKLKSVLVTLPLPREHELALLDFTSRLRSGPQELTIYEDVALILEHQVRDGLLTQVIGDTPVGIAAKGAFVGSDQFCRVQRYERYRDFPALPAHESVSMESVIVVAEIAHDALHHIFFAQHVRGQAKFDSTWFAEEVALSWYEAICFTKAYPWIEQQALTSMNERFSVIEENQKKGFWNKDPIYLMYAPHCPWIYKLIDKLPGRKFYVTDRPDAEEYEQKLAAIEGTRFLAERPAEDRRIALMVGPDRLTINPKEALGMLRPEAPAAALHQPDTAAATR